ncbi:unnamed protein product [Linum tenue]|uniref:Uncharacterized protein n=1 Tax=Linum tenue TaxID=586396 RepID=A0AAV0MGF6_9ROSI|nr:unnamed protein product [Linum tenue]
MILLILDLAPKWFCQ